MREGVEIITPSTRQRWLSLRQMDITASVVGSLFGCHDFVSPLELWASKTGRLAMTTDETEPMRRGRLLEPVAVQILREEHPDWQVDYSSADQVYYRDPARRLGATPDAQVMCPRRGKGVVQIKSVEAGTFRKKWVGDDGHPEAPLWIALQATLEAWLTGAEWAAVCPLVVGFGVEAPLIDIPLDHMDGVIDAMTERSAEFWQMVAEDREPPVDYQRDAALIDRLFAHGDAREEVDLTRDDTATELIEEIAIQREIFRKAEKRVLAAETEIKAKMGTAEIAHVAGGRTIVWKTYRRPNPGGLPTIYRVLRLPK